MYFVGKATATTNSSHQAATDGSFRHGSEMPADSIIAQHLQLCYGTVRKCLVTEAHTKNTSQMNKKSSEIDLNSFQEAFLEMSPFLR